jgi:hypothetical protein
MQERKLEVGKLEVFSKRKIHENCDNLLLMKMEAENFSHYWLRLKTTCNNLKSVILYNILYYILHHALRSYFCTIGNTFNNNT